MQAPAETAPSEKIVKSLDDMTIEERAGVTTKVCELLKECELADAKV
jgi:hypothetical protein